MASDQQINRLPGLLADQQIRSTQSNGLLRSMNVAIATSSDQTILEHHQKISIERAQFALI